MHMQTSDYGVSCRSFGTLIMISIPPLLLPHVLSCYCILRFTALYVNYLVILVSSLNHTGEIHLLPSSLHPLPRHYYYYISIPDYVSFYLSSLSDFIAQESKKKIFDLLQCLYCTCQRYLSILFPLPGLENITRYFLYLLLICLLACLLSC